MRKIKELLEFVLKEGNQNFTKGDPQCDLDYDGYIGLCGFVRDLRNKNKITFEEFGILSHFIINNRPTPDSQFYSKKEKFECYYWPRRKWTPRKRWIEYQIKSL